MFASEKVETQARRARIKELQSILKGRNEWKWRILDLAYVIGQSNHPEDLRIALSNDRDREVYNALLQENI